MSEIYNEQTRQIPPDAVVYKWRDGTLKTRYDRSELKDVVVFLSNTAAIPTAKRDTFLDLMASLMKAQGIDKGGTLTKDAIKTILITKADDAWAAQEEE